MSEQLIIPTIAEVKAVVRGKKGQSPRKSGTYRAARRNAARKFGLMRDWYEDRIRGVSPTALCLKIKREARNRMMKLELRRGQHEGQVPSDTH